VSGLLGVERRRTFRDFTYCIVIIYFPIASKYGHGLLCCEIPRVRKKSGLSRLIACHRSFFSLPSSWQTLVAQTASGLTSAAD
jgi:hypothetical protein